MESARARIVNLTRKISVGGIILLTGLLPLMFLPFTMEFFEFNKSVLFIGVMLVVLVSWLINLAFTGTVSFWKTSYDNWIIGILAVSAISYVLSQEKTTSLIGFSGRLSEGVIVLIFLIAMTFIVRHVVTSRKLIDFIVWALLISGALVSLISILHYYGFYFFEGIDRLSSTAVRSFTTLGSSNALPYFLLGIIPVGLSFVIANARDAIKSSIATVLLGIAGVGFAISAGGVLTWPGIFLWIVLLAAIGFVLFMSGRAGKIATKWVVVLAVFLVGGLLVRNISSIDSKLASNDEVYLPSPSLQYDVAWRVAASTLSESPVTGLFGSGPDTFAYDFTQYRPMTYNSSANWNIRFTRSSSQMLEILGNTGVIGFVVWTLLFVTGIIWLSQTLKENHENPYRMYMVGLGAGIGVLFVSSFVTFFTVNLWFLLWLYLGVIVAVRAVSNPRLAEKVKLSLSLSREKISVEEHDVLPYVMLVPALIIFLVGAFGLVKLYRGEKLYQDARYSLASATEDDDAIEVLTGSLQTLGEAISQADFRDSYHADYGVLAVNLLREYSAKAEEEQTEEYQSIQSTLLALSTESVEKATELNPINVRNWESRAYVYQELVKLTQGGYGDALLAAINQALLYDPVKPQLYHQRGVVLSLGGLDEEALDELRTAVNLQPLYLASRYDLAMQYQKMGRNDDAIAQLNFILEVLDQNNLSEVEAYGQIEDAIDALEEGLTADETEAIPDESEDLALPDVEDISTEEEYVFPEEEVTTVDEATNEEVPVE